MEEKLREISEPFHQYLPAIKSKFEKELQNMDMDAGNGNAEELTKIVERFQRVEKNIGNI